MMGPGGNLDSAMTLLDVVNDPKKYKKMLKDLAQAVVDSDKRETLAIEAECKAHEAQKKAENALKRLRTKELRLEKELKVKEVEIDEKIDLLNGEISQKLGSMEEDRQIIDDKTQEIDTKVKYVEKQSKELSEKAVLLKNLEDRLIKENANIERKKKIIADL